MVGVIVDAKMLLDELGDPLQCPEVCPVTGSQWTRQQQFRQPLLLGLGQLGRTPGNRFRAKTGGSVLLVGLVPPGDRALGGSQPAGDRRQRFSLIQQLDGLLPPLFQLLWTSLGSHNPKDT